MLACKFVAGLDIEYGKKGSRKATLSVWRTHVVNTADGNESRVVQEVADDVCLILRHYSFFSTLTFFTCVPRRLRKPYRSSRPTTSAAYEELAHNEIGDEDREPVVSTQQLCEYRDAAETMVGITWRAFNCSRAQEAQKTGDTSTAKRTD